MPLTTAGRNWIAGAITGHETTLFNNDNARIGVGNGTGGDAASTDLTGASKFRKGMEDTYPQRSTNVLTFRSSYGDAEANFAWEEWGIFNHADAGTMLSRKVENKGTKSGGTWNFTVEVTVNIGS